MEETPKTSIRIFFHQLEINQTTVVNFLKKINPNHNQRVNFPRRVEWYMWFLQEDENDPHFCKQEFQIFLWALENSIM